MRSQGVRSLGSAEDAGASSRISPEPSRGANNPSTRRPPRVNCDEDGCVRAPSPRNRWTIASATCAEAVRPNRASHAFGIGSALVMMPENRPLPATLAPGEPDDRRLVSRSTTVSSPSSWASSRIGTDTVFDVSPAANVSVPETGV